MAETDLMRPSPWVVRHAARLAPDRHVLDLACGRGRHTQLLLAGGHHVTALDLAIESLGGLRGHPRVEAIAADLENGETWPLGERRFDCVVVTNYLWRPILGRIVAAVAPGGMLLYETFAAGHEAFGRPGNPDFLLRKGELITAVEGALDILAFREGMVWTPEGAPHGGSLAVTQAIAAVRPLHRRG